MNDTLRGPLGGCHLLLTLRRCYQEPLGPALCPWPAPWGAGGADGHGKRASPSSSLLTWPFSFDKINSGLEIGFFFLLLFSLLKRKCRLLVRFIRNVILESTFLTLVFIRQKAEGCQVKELSWAVLLATETTLLHVPPQRQKHSVSSASLFFLSFVLVTWGNLFIWLMN